MAVLRLEIANLRCIAEAAVALDAERNLIVGPNGAGKTTILEAAHVLGRGHSFRVRDNRRLIRRGEREFVVRCECAGGGAARRIGVGYTRGSLDVRIDGVGNRRASELAECLPIEVIDAGAHRLIDGGPGERRRFIDWGLFHVEPGYVGLWRDFRRVLVQRNEALRRGVGDAELEVWDDGFVEVAGRLDAVRMQFVERWGKRTREIGDRLLGVEVGVEYRSGGGSGGLREALRVGRARERERGLTLAGPHRGELTVRLNGGLAREIASRGQQKLLAATLITGRLADRIACGGDGGLVLVDDPAAELDAGALDRLIGTLSGLPVQMLVTAIEAQPLQRLAAGRVFHVEQGIIEPA